MPSCQCPYFLSLSLFGSLPASQIAPPLLNVLFLFFLILFVSSHWSIFLPLALSFELLLAYFLSPFHLSFPSPAFLSSFFSPGSSGKETFQASQLPFSLLEQVLPSFWLVCRLASLGSGLTPISHQLWKLDREGHGEVVGNTEHRRPEQF